MTKGTKQWSYPNNVVGVLKNPVGKDFDDEFLCIRTNPDAPVDVLDTFGFVSHDCAGNMRVGSHMCSKCYDSRKRLYRKMDNVIELRKDNIALTTKKSIFDSSPGLLLNQNNMLMKDRKKNNLSGISQGKN